MKNERQKLADLYTEYASDETAYFEYNKVNVKGWTKIEGMPAINSDLDRWRVTTPYRKKVEQAFENGARIKVKTKSSNYDQWFISASRVQDWDWDCFDYRIEEVKPFSTYAVITKEGGLAVVDNNEYYCKNIAEKRNWRFVELVEKVDE